MKLNLLRKNFQTIVEHNLEYLRLCAKIQIFVFNESTSSLDGENAKLVKEVIYLSKNITAALWRIDYQLSINFI